ncbi:DsbA family protein [Vibrio methylphosphonaticus]|uniref:DsbA family protein n=1 Tax=Vibrio methylphosphonaticus TaxID=2946866 RepID=UPI002029C964|nr:thioredoxin domain-containing protein [Vibrio methylphosphonaticus]MCL9773824.1 thioredoxin domain-containing protein [Vibrio methylphosphonaticus]
MKSIFILMALMLSHFASVASPYQAGLHYLTLSQQPTIEPQVMLFHSPFCGPCAVVHDPLVQIADKHNAELREIVVGMGPLGRDVQEAFIVAKEQGLENRFMGALIRRIHFRKNQAPEYRQDLVSVLKKCGVNQDKFIEQCQSISVQVEDFNRLVQRYRIRSTPTIIINGNKQVVLHQLNSFDELEQLIEELLAS